ncbi:hypothetical protein KM043_018348 [Ampulex compressa]|nr:hypothetical protein KM043_018348 [Ampulex compressa]
MSTSALVTGRQSNACSSCSDFGWRLEGKPRKSFTAMFADSCGFRNTAAFSLHRDTEISSGRILGIRDIKGANAFVRMSRYRSSRSDSAPVHAYGPGFDQIFNRAWTWLQGEAADFNSLSALGDGISAK